MERISLQTDRKAIIAEHTHRYKLSSILSRGKVLDISCGIGYGSQIICESNLVTSYTGVDIAKEEIDYANETFKTAKSEFLSGDICKLDFPDKSFDTIVCLETLEHIPEPKSALKELSRVLKEDGLLIGSVPEASYDDKCERIYGPNPHHLHKFSRTEISNNLKEHFATIAIKIVGFTLGTFVEGQKTEISHIIYDKPEGSYFFIASKTARDLETEINKISGTFMPALSMAEYDEELSMPLRQTIRDQAKLIDIRDEAIVHMEQTIISKDETIAQIEQMVRSRDEAIKNMEQVIEKRWAIIQEYDAKVKLLEGVK